MKVSKELLVDLQSANEGQTYGEFEVIENKISSHSRWSINYTLIVKYQGKFYETYYSIGATEYQDETPWQYQNEVDLKEVNPVQKTITVYEPISA